MKGGGGGLRFISDCEVLLRQSCKNPPVLRYVQKCTLMRFMNCMIDITRCPLTLILTKTHIILSNMKSYENDKKACFI